MPTMAPVREADWREALHPRGPDGRFIDLLSALKQGDEKDVTGALQSILYDFPPEQDVRLDIGGVEVHSRAGSPVFRTTPDQGNRHLGYPSTAAYSIVAAAKEREASRKDREAKAAKPKRASGGKTVLKHVMADGRVVTRTTARDYTHVVTAVNAEGKRVDLTWSGSAEAAEKNAQSRRNRGYWKGVKVEKIRPPKTEEGVEEAFTAPSGGGQPRYSGAARDARQIARSQGLKPGSHRLGSGGGRGAWDEKKHPRGSKGTSRGGKFISKGDSGGGVRAVQQRLGTTRVDGKYGARTKAAVRQFQRKNGLVVDGVVGRQTAMALAGNAEKARRTKTGRLTSADRRMIRKAANRKRG